MAMAIWLVRHGETTSNAAGVFQGHLDVGLNERGERQAARVGEHLCRTVFDAVYASDLQRAARTAEIIVGGRARVLLDPDLREMHYGVLQGIRYDEAQSTLDAHGLADAWTSGEIYRSGAALPGGESLRRFRARSQRFMRRIRQNHGAGDHQILVVAHGGKLAILLTVLLGLPGGARRAFRFANCGLSRVTITDQRAVLDFHNLIVWNDSCGTTDAELAPRPRQQGE